MELSSLIKLNKPKPNPKYLAIEIGPESVRTASWEIVQGKPTVLQIGSNEIVNTQDYEQLLQGIDASLVQAQIGIEPEPSQAILSLPDSWLVDGEIALDKKAILKHISKELELKILGYFMTIDALNHYLEITKGQPPNLILLGISNEEVLVSVVKNGKLIGTQTVGRSDDLGSDVKEGLARFEDLPTLPAHMVMYDGSTDLEQYQQELIDFDWQTDLPFLHPPKIDRLSGDEVVKAVVLTGGMEVVEANSAQDEGASDETETITSPIPVSQDSVPDLQEEFGFRATQTTEPDPEVGGDDLETQLTPADSNVVEADDFDPEPEADDVPKPKKSLFGGFKLALPKFSRRRGPGKTNFGKIILILGILLVLVGVGMVGAFWAVWNLPKAQVTIVVDPLEINRQISFTVSPGNSGVDLNNNLIQGVAITTELTAQSQTVATGEKLVGERAKGKVTVFNRTNSVKVFAAGTQLTGPNGKIYTLDEEVRIASASSRESSDFSVTIEPARAEVGVTAANIGADYNLDNDVEFSVANFDKVSYVAKATGAISGGTSRQITAVAASDITLLNQLVEQELENKILAEVNKAQPNYYEVILLEDGSDQRQEEYSAKVGDEANSVNLEVKTLVRSLSFKKLDVAALVQAAVGSEMSTTYQPQAEDVDVEVIQSSEQADGTVSVDALVKIKTVPQLEIETIQKAISGKKPSVIEDFFRDKTSAKKVTLNFTPNLPLFNTFLPRRWERIDVIVEINSSSNGESP